MKRSRYRATLCQVKHLKHDMYKLLQSLLGLVLIKGFDFEKTPEGCVCLLIFQLLKKFVIWLRSIHWLQRPLYSCLVFVFIPREQKDNSYEH